MPFTDPTNNVAVVSGVPQAIDIGNSVNQRMPWESGQSPVSLQTVSTFMTKDGADHTFTWSKLLANYATSSISTWTVPNGYRFRVTTLGVYVDVASAATASAYPSGYAGLQDTCIIPWGVILNEPYYQWINPEGLEYLAGQSPVALYNMNNNSAPQTYIKVNVQGFLYTP